MTTTHHPSLSSKVSDNDIESLECLCLQQIALNLRKYRLEGLPKLFLHKLLPVLSVHDLHRLHHLTTKKDLNTQPFWYKYYTETFEKGWRGKRCYCIPHEGATTPDWRQCYLDKRCSMLLNTQFITLLMPGAQPVTPSYSQKLTCQALKHPMIDPQQTISHNALRYNPILHHPECLSLRAGSCSFLLDVPDLQSHLCASVKELQIDHLQEKYTDQVGLLLTILLGHGVIDKLTLRHSRLAQVAQLKEILQICAGPGEESTTTEPMETHETSTEATTLRCNENQSVDGLPMKIAKTDTAAMAMTHRSVSSMTTTQRSLHQPHNLGSTRMHRDGTSHSVAKSSEAWSCTKPRVTPDRPHTSGCSGISPQSSGVADSAQISTNQSKPDEDLFDLCFTEPIKHRQDNQSAPTCSKFPAKRQPPFYVQIPKKKYDMRSTRERVLHGGGPSTLSFSECQLCRSVQYSVEHSVRAVTQVVLLGFTLDVRDCVAIGDVLSGWMALKRIELVDNLLSPEATHELLLGLRVGSQHGQRLTHLIIEDNCVCDINAPVLLELLEAYQRNDSNHVHTLKVRTADMFLESPLSGWDGSVYPPSQSTVSLPSALQHIFQGIVVLDLSHQSLSQVAVYAIINALSHQDTRIAHLKLESCDLRTDSLDQIFLTAKCSSSIHSLNVSGNMYTANTHTGLVELLRDGELDTLDISNCKFSLHGWQEDLVGEFVAALKNTRHLRQLRLAGNQFNENDLRILAKVFVESSSTPRITPHDICLDLSFNHALSPQAMIKFANTLRSSSKSADHMTLNHLRFHASSDGVQNQELLRELRLAIPSVDLWSLHSATDYDTFIAEQQSQM